jgi:hypothetical protein
MVANTKMAGPLGSVRRLGTPDVARIFDLAF